MPKISVIIPVYNVEKYLSRCLDSIINQTLSDIEIICINDGSSDNSAEILELYSKNDNRIKIITQENKGLSIARNTGLSEAKGEYVSFIDSDDWISPNFFEKLYTSAVKFDADIAAAGIVCVRKGKWNKLVNYDDEIVTQDFAKKLDLCEIPWHCFVWNKIYRRENLKTKFEDGRIYEDMLFTPVALFNSNRLVTVPNASYYYFRHKNSIVKSKTKKSKDDFIYAKNKMRQFLIDCGIDITKYKPKIKKYKFLGITFFKTINKNKSKEYVLLNFIKWRKKK